MKSTTTHYPDHNQVFAWLGISALHAALSPASLDRPRNRSGSPKLGLLERLDRWAAGLRQKDMERYLAESRDIFELEARLRDIERRPFL